MLSLSATPLPAPTIPGTPVAANPGGVQRDHCGWAPTPIPRERSPGGRASAGESVA